MIKWNGIIQIAIDYFHERKDWQKKTFLLKITRAKENWDNSFLWKNDKVYGRVSKIPSKLKSESQTFKDPKRIINEINTYFAKIGRRLINDRRSSNRHQADMIKSFIDSTRVH